MNDFLLELLVEEIPARFQSDAVAHFERLILDELRKNRIEYENIKSYVSPRRLVFSAKLNARIHGFTEEKKGPQITAPTEVIEKFIKSTGVSKKDCHEKVIDKKTFIVANIAHNERKTVDVLAPIIKNAIIGIQWPKSMHWGNNSFSFVRPLRNIMCFFNNIHVDIDFEAEMNLKSSNHTFGHRFMCNKQITASNIIDYINRMKKAFVIVDHQERRQIILDTCSNIASIKNGLTACISEDLLDEVVGLVEYPLVLVGKIPEKFMELPEEIVITPMKTHQRYFPTKTKGKLAPYFIFVANNHTYDNGQTVIEGNERVLNARLADALFFFETDLQKPLDSRLDDLKKIVFNEKLGTVYDMVCRIKNICNYLCDEMTDVAQIDSYRMCLDRAAILSKCDLSTNMVCEFTELQGIMGAHYAKLQGESPEVCEIIRDQYKSVDDICSLSSALFSIADKVDIMTSLFAIGKEPTGSKDPFALRRAALGILKIIKKYDINISIEVIVKKSFEQLNSKIAGLDKNTVNKVMSFMVDRLRVLLKDSSISHDVAYAVTSAQNNVLDVYKKAAILDESLKNEIGAKLIAMYKRAKNITQNNTATDINEKFFEENEEKSLYKAINKLESDLNNINTDTDIIEKFRKKVMHCILVENALSNFFDKVLVNTENEKIRQNRINMLNKLIKVFDINLPEISLLG